MPVMKVPHVRLEMPKGTKGKLRSGHLMGVYITFPGQEEIRAGWVKGISHKMHIDEPTTVVIEMLATVEVHDAT